MNHETTNMGDTDFDVPEQEFELVEERVGTIDAWIKKLQAEAKEKGMYLLQDKAYDIIRGLPFVAGKIQRGFPCKLYIERDVREACKNVLFPEIRENGTVILGNGQVGIGPNAYAETVRLSGETLLKIIRKAGIKPIGNAFNVSHQVDVYDKNEVDNLIPPRPQEDGTVLMKNGLIGIAPRIYSKALGIGEETLLNRIKKAGIQSIGKVLCSPRTVDIYDKNEVDSLILPRVEENGTVVLNDKQSGVAIHAYATFIGITSSTLERWIKKKNLGSVGKAMTHSLTVDVFLKEAVDAIIPPLLRNDGVVILKDGQVGIGINAYAKTVRTTYTTLARLIEAAKLKPIGEAFNRVRTVDIFCKEAVDRIIQNNRRFPS